MSLIHQYQNICDLELDKKVLQSTENIQEGDHCLPAGKKKQVRTRVQNCECNEMNRTIMDALFHYF